jgi:hypothetical protein
LLAFENRRVPLKELSVLQRDPLSLACGAAAAPKLWSVERAHAADVVGENISSDPPHGRFLLCVAFCLPGTGDAILFHEPEKQNELL